MAQKKTVHCSREGYSNPNLRCSIMQRVFRSQQGGKPYQWSARKAQLVSNLYRKAGGKFSGKKSLPQLSLKKWTDQEWTTKSGSPSLKTGERYLPKRAIRKLTNEQYRRTSRAKRTGMKRGKQFVRQPKDIARLTKAYRQNAPSHPMPLIRGIHMNDANREEVMAKYTDETGEYNDYLLWFFAHWCDHCTLFLQTYNQIQESMPTHVTCLSIDVDESPRLCQEFSIQGVPTLYKVSKGKPTLYEGPRTVRAIKDFMEK